MVEKGFQGSSPTLGWTEREMPRGADGMADSLAEDEAERRLRRRFELDLDIRFGSESHFWEARTGNLSEGGVFISTAELKPISSEIDLTIALPAPLPTVWARGEVRWIGESAATADALLGMGIQFRMISQESLDNIRQFLRTRFSTPTIGGGADDANKRS